MKENLVFKFNRLLIGILLLLLVTTFYFLDLDIILYLIITLFIFYDIYNSKLINNRLLILCIIFALINILYYNLNSKLIILLILIQIFSIILILFVKKYIKESFLISLICFILLFHHLNILDRNLFYLVIFLSFLNDTSAYIFGRFIKGPLILPKISPKKTWSGTVISFLISASFLFFLNFNIFLSILISSSFFLGDILFSFVKRSLNIKDFSKILSEHGGSLDRLDSIFLPVLIINLNLIV